MVNNRVYAAPNLDVTISLPAIYFDEASGSSPVYRDIWRAQFTGPPSAKAKLSKIDESSKMLIENLGFTGRLRYEISALLTFDGKNHVLRSEADSFAMLGGESLRRELSTKALTSIARQANAILAASAKPTQ